MWFVYVIILSSLLAEALAIHACGDVHCIDQPGVYCDENDKCQCPAGYIGNPTIHCVNPVARSVCLIYGDPHIESFAYEFFRLPLPCHTTLAYFVTPPNFNLPNGCTVHVTGRATNVEDTSNTFISYERVIYMTITSTGNQFRALFGKEGIEFKELVKLEGYDMFSHIGRFHVNTGYDMNEFVWVDVPKCDVYIKFRYQDGSFAIDKPIGSVGDDGLCGVVRTNITCTTPEVFPTSKEILKRTLDWLTNENPIDQTNPNIYNECTELTIAWESCPSSQKAVVCSFCGMIPNDSGVNACLVGARNLTGAFAQFTLCSDYMCAGTDPCTVYSEVFAECVGQPAVVNYLNANCVK